MNKQNHQFLMSKQNQQFLMSKQNHQFFDEYTNRLLPHDLKSLSFKDFPVTLDE